MAIDERRRKALQELLEREVGPEGAAIMMDAVFRDDLATKTDVQAVKTDVQAVKTDVQALKTDVQALKTDVQALRGEVRRVEERLEAKIEISQARLEAKVETSESRLEAKIEQLRAESADRTNEQTKTLYRTFMVTNAAMVMTVAGLAFSAARFA